MHDLGWAHNTGNQPQRDERRDAWLTEQGVRTLRLTAATVKELEAALATIWAVARG